MGDVVKLILHRARPDEIPGHDVQASATRLKLTEDARSSPAADSQIHADERFTASSKETLETLLSNVRMQHDRLDRVIDAVPDEKARTRFRYALDGLRDKIEFVRAIAKSI